METLSTADQETVKKMNTDRLRAKLLQAELDEDQLLAIYAEHLMSGKAEAE